MSADYNFLNLDSFEFEQLCSDVLSIYLKKKFRVFAPGPDGGVDIKQENGSDRIIGQAKRYKEPSVDFCLELEKIKRKTKCKKYYFFISCKLSNNKKTEIFNTFHDYMDDQNYIFDSIRLNSLLDTDEYENVLKKHFRLWATSLRVLNLLKSNNIAIDTNTFLENVTRHQKYYVDTLEYYNALKVFEENRIVLIKGEPGVGKTTTSEMIVLTFIKKYPNTHFIYSSSGNIDSLRNSLSNNPDVTELVFIDDFLGDIYLNLHGDRVKNISSFINYFKHTKNKFLIINTRVVILKDALNKYLEFSNSLSAIGIKEIELKNLTKKDKALILYNHIYFSDIPLEHKKTFLDKKMYVTIVEHSHYNPRLIEAICNNKRFELSNLDFENYVKTVLEQQSFTWKHSFENNLSEADRILLHVLYSFGHNYVNCDSLEKAFRYEISKNSSIDKSIDVFEQSVARLSDAFISIVFVYGIKKITFINPSVKDCLKSINYFDKDSDFLFIDQYLFVYGEDNFLKSKKLNDIIFENKLGDLHFELLSKIHTLALFFTKNVVLDKRLEAAYLSCMSLDYSFGFIKVGNNYYRDIFRSLINEDYLQYYDLSKLSRSGIHTLVSNCFALLNINETKSVLNHINHDTLIDIFDDKIKARIIKTIFDDYDKKDAIDEGITYFSTEDGQTEVFSEEQAKEYAVSDIYTKIYETYNELFDEYDFEIEEEDIADFVDADDFKKEYEDSYKVYDNEYDGYVSDDNGCYDIFKNLIR